MKRIMIKWETVNKIECRGIAVVHEWDEDQSYHDAPNKETKISIQVTRTSTGTQNMPANLDKEIHNELTSMMRIFFDGVCWSDTTHKWLELKNE